MRYVHKGCVQKAKKIKFLLFLSSMSSISIFSLTYKTGMKPQSPSNCSFCLVKEQETYFHFTSVSSGHASLNPLFPVMLYSNQHFLVQAYIALCNPQWTMYKILNRSSRLVSTGWQGVLWKTAKTRWKMKEHKPVSWPQTADCSNFWTASAACVH